MLISKHKYNFILRTVTTFQSQTTRHIKEERDGGRGQLSREKKINRTRIRYDSLLKTLDRKIKIAILNMLKALMEKVSNMHERIGNFSSEMDIIQRSQMEMIEIIIVETLT